MAFGVPGAEHEMQATLEALALEHGKVSAMRIGLMGTHLTWHKLVYRNESRSAWIVFFLCHRRGYSTLFVLGASKDVRSNFPLGVGISLNCHQKKR
jgi:hypothetical protein